MTTITNIYCICMYNVAGHPQEGPVILAWFFSRFLPIKGALSSHSCLFGALRILASVEPISVVTAAGLNKVALKWMSDLIAARAWAKANWFISKLSLKSTYCPGGHTQCFEFFFFLFFKGRARWNNRRLSASITQKSRPIPSAPGADCCVVTF